MGTKKVGNYLGKIFKWILWILLLGALLFLVIGYAKFDGGIKDYTRYLNEKDWNEAVSKVEILDLSSYGNLFWTESTGVMITGSGSVIDSSEIDEVEELEVDLGDEALDTGDMDVFDPEFADDFESFFAQEEESDEDNKDSEGISNDNEDGFGFVNNDTGSDISGDVEDEELSDNKKSLLKLFGR